VRPADRFLYTCKTAIVPDPRAFIPAARFQPEVIKYRRGERHDLVERIGMACVHRMQETGLKAPPVRRFHPDDFKKTCDELNPSS